jgi:hypothetical protein
VVYFNIYTRDVIFQCKMTSIAQLIISPFAINLAKRQAPQINAANVTWQFGSR